MAAILNVNVDGPPEMFEMVKADDGVPEHVEVPATATIVLLELKLTPVNVTVDVSDV